MAQGAAVNKTLWFMHSLMSHALNWCMMIACYGSKHEARHRCMTKAASLHSVWLPQAKQHCHMLEITAITMYIVQCENGF